MLFFRAGRSNAQHIYTLTLFEALETHPHPPSATKAVKRASTETACSCRGTTPPSRQSTADRLSNLQVPGLGASLTAAVQDAHVAAGEHR